MAVFKMWDQVACGPGEDVTVNKADVARAYDCTLKNKARKHVGCTKVVLKDGSTFAVCVPAGEFHDRLNDAGATAPDPDLFAGMQQASSHPDEDEDMAPDEDGPAAVAD